MKKLLFLLPVLLFVFSCNKYEDGPSFSLRTKTHRLANTWTVESVTGNGTDLTADFKTWYPDYMLTITKENTYVLTYKLNSGIEYKETGTWVYNGDKTHVIFKNSATGGMPDWKILRLKEKEFWGEHIDVYQTRTYVVHFKPAF